MTPSQNPNATVAFDVVSAPADAPLLPSDSDTLTNDPAADDAGTGHELPAASTDATQADSHSLTQKEKLKAGGIGAAAGAAAGIAATAAAMTYGTDALHSIEQAGTDALHSVESFLGFKQDEIKPEPVGPPAPGPTKPNRPEPDAHQPTHHPQNHDTPPAHQPVEHTETPVPAPTDNHLVDLDHDGTPDAVIVDDNGTAEMIVDADHDGAVDSVLVDTDHDGEFDTGFVDVNHDGYADQELIDTNHDGNPDMVVVDTDGDHGLDTVYADTNHDGQITADDDHQATGQDTIVPFTDQPEPEQHEVNAPAAEHIAETDHPADENYNNEADVHEWA